MTGLERHAHRRALWMVAGCAALWSLNGPLIKTLTAEPYAVPGVAIALWRSAIAALALLPFARGGLSHVPRTGWWVPAVLSFAAMCGCFVTANQHTEAANAIVIQYMAPFWIFLLSPLLLGERPRRNDWLVLPVAMAGIGIIFCMQFDQAGLGLMLGLASGVAFAFVMLSFRRLRDADPLAAPLIANAGTAILLVPAALMQFGTIPLPNGAGAWGWLAVLGVVQMAAPYWLLAHALRHVTASEASLITLSELLLNPTWTFLWIGERPKSSTLAGGALIIAALLLKNRLDRRAEASSRVRP